jgi:hypothetical protein
MKYLLNEIRAPRAALRAERQNLSLLDEGHPRPSGDLIDVPAAPDAYLVVIQRAHANARR